MKVCISTYTFLPDIGGVATTESILASAFAEAGHDVTVVTTSEGPSEGYGYRVVRNPGPFAMARLYAGADILILSNLSVRLFYPLLVMPRRFGLRHHSESAAHLSHSPVDRLRRRVMKRAVNFATSSFIGEKIGVPHHVVHPFANPEHITPDLLQPQPERRGAVFVGRLEEEKGILYLLERWQKVKDRLGIDELRVVGDGACRDEIVSSIERGALPGVTYLGRLSLADTAAEMGRAAYSFIPSLWEEPFGAVATESLAAGAVVILSDRGGLPEAAGSLGFSFDPSREEEFDAALERACAFRDRLLASPEAQQDYAAACNKHLAQFDPQGAVKKIVAAFG